MFDDGDAKYWGVDIANGVNRAFYLREMRLALSRSGSLRRMSSSINLKGHRNQYCMFGFPTPRARVDLRGSLRGSNADISRSELRSARLA